MDRICRAVPYPYRISKIRFQLCSSDDWSIWKKVDGRIVYSYMLRSARNWSTRDDRTRTIIITNTTKTNTCTSMWLNAASKLSCRCLRNCQTRNVVICVAQALPCSSIGCVIPWRHAYMHNISTGWVSKRLEPQFECLTYLKGYWK